MSKKYRSVKDQLRIVVNKFTPGELQNFVMPVFPEITWQEVQKELKEAKKPASVENVFTLFDNVITKNRLKNDDIKMRILELQTIEVSRHNHTRMWYGHSLLGKIRKISDCKHEELQDEIANALTCKKIDAEVKMLTYEGILYICIREKLSNRLAVNCSPTYFALFLEQKCLFCTKKNGTSNYIKPIIKSLGFQSSSPIDIMGKDLRTLVNLIWNEKQSAFHPEPRGEIYYDKDPEPNDDGTDYTESFSRKEYASDCVSTDQPNQESLVIHIPEQQWRHKEISAKVQDKIRIECEIRSPNIPEFLVELAERNILTTPLPEYIRHVMSLPTRAVTVVDKNDEDVNDLSDQDEI